MTDQFSGPTDFNLSRRRFVQGIAAGGILLNAGSFASRAWAIPVVASPSALRATEFNLSIDAMPVNFTGSTRMATAINGQVPAPTLYWNEGDTVTLRVTNKLNVVSSVHWHGILLPFQMDGVPGLSYNGIAPGETFVYRFPVRQSGTYWYHSHSRFQEQTGLYGALVIAPKNGERFPSDREYVVMLSDWTDENPERIFAKLKKMSDYYNFNMTTAQDFMQDAKMMGFSGAFQKRRMWNQMRMSPTDYSDVTGYTFTYLVNGTSPSGNWTGLFKRGEKIRLRFINSSATTIFDVRIPGLKLKVVAADGQDVEPVSVDEFRISVAETYDVIVEPNDDRAYTLFAQSIDRSGYARGTLAPSLGMQAEIPLVDRPVWLGMTDMMGAMGGMQKMANMGKMSPAMDGKPAMKDTNQDMPNMEGMKGMDDGMAGMEGMDKDMSDMKGMDHGSMNKSKSMAKARHAKAEYGPNVNSRVDTPRTNLDDPGINLRNNGRRVLTYADLHTIGGPQTPHDATRDMEIHLTGHMERFIWSFDGVKFADSTPLHFRYGEKLRVILHNDTMMNHPIHLHGMFSEVESADGKFQVRKHTVNVQPAQRISFLVDATEKGRWAFHCHLQYHMEAGMFREVILS